MNFRNTQADAVDTRISVSSPIISSRVSLGFCEKKRWKESEWKHQRYHIRTSHQYIFHILYSASKCISCSTLAYTVCVQCSFEDFIYRFQQERRGAKYVASSAPVSLLHPRHWAIQDEVNQLETHPVSESFFPQQLYFEPLKSDQVRGRIPYRFMTTTCGYLLARKGPGRGHLLIFVYRHFLFVYNVYV